MATNTELTSLATGQRHKKASAETEALRSQPGDGSRQPRALLFHSLVLYGFQPWGLRLPGPKSVPCDLAGPKVVVIHEALTALSARHCGSSRNMLFCSFNSLATIPLRLGCGRSSKNSASVNSCSQKSNASSNGEKFSHLIGRVMWDLSRTSSPSLRHHPQHLPQRSGSAKPAIPQLGKHKKAPPKQGP